MRLRIAIVIGSLNYGGAERFCIDLANTLVKMGHFVTIVSFSSMNPLKCKLIDAVNLDVIRYHKIAKFLNIMELIKLFIKRHIQIVDSHLFYSNIYGVIAAFIAHVPVIVTHEHTLTPWKKWYHRIVGLLLSKITDKIIAISKSVALNRINKERIVRSKIIVIPTGIELEKFNFDYDFRSDAHTCYIGFVGRLVPAKNIDSLLEIYEYVQRILPNVKLLIVGDGPLRRNIQKVMLEKKLTDKIIITGFTQYPEQYIKKISVLVLPSIREGLPVSVLEAFAAGIPVVATRVGALPELIRDGENGFLFYPDEHKKAASFIIRLLTDENLQKKVSANAKESAQRYNIEKVAYETVKLYESILRKKRI